MTFFKQHGAPGISLKISLGLLIITMAAFISSGVTRFYFNKSAIMFQTISNGQLPLLFTASKLAKEVEGLISDGSEIALTENPLLLESLSDSVKADYKTIEELISELELAEVKEVPYLSKNSRLIFENLQTLVIMIKKYLEIDQRILQISIHIRQISELILLGRDPQQGTLGRIQKLFIQLFSLLRDVPNIQDSQRLEEYQGQIFALKNMIHATLHSEDYELLSSHKKDLSIAQLNKPDSDISEISGYYKVVETYGIGEKGLLSLAKTKLIYKTAIQDRLVQISFLSDELVKQSEKVFSAVSQAIHQQSHKVSVETKLIEKLILLVPCVIVISAVLIFMFIRRSVIGRILLLEQSMKEHVMGNPIPIPVEGDDEITSMAQSVSYFVEKRNEYESTLKDARVAAEKANKAKSLFIANMSHELRTPLNAILGFSQLLIHNKALSSDETEYLDSIRKSGEHLLVLINQVLDLSTIEAGRLQLKESEFNLWYILDEIKYMFNIKAINKELFFRFELENDVPQFIQTDQIKLRQVLINLINNAFKFTEKGGITVRVKVKKSNEKIFYGKSVEYKSLRPENRTSVEIDNSKNTKPFDKKSDTIQLLFEVEDTGIGILPDDTTKIFDAFEQTATGRMAKEGTGLGLTISRNFIELMGGQIKVESKAGEGTMFQFDISAKAIQTEIEEPTLSHFPHLQNADFIKPVLSDSQMHLNGSCNWSDRIAVLPVNLKQDMSNALLKADMDAIESVIIQIKEQDSALAAKLKEWAHDFEYEKIISMIANTKG